MLTGETLLKEKNVINNSNIAVGADCFMRSGTKIIEG